MKRFLVLRILVIGTALVVGVMSVVYRMGGDDLPTPLLNAMLPIGIVGALIVFLGFPFVLYDSLRRHETRATREREE